MVQLTLIRSQTEARLDDLLHDLHTSVRRSAVARRYADEARRATARRFASIGARPLTTAERRRVRDYFNAVMRRALLASRDADAIPLRRRLVAASIEADLVDAGWSREKARAEALRAVGESEVAEGVA